jgi:hypothetical protein
MYSKIHAYFFGSGPKKDFTFNQKFSFVKSLNFQIRTLPSPDTPLPAERGKSVSWNLHLSEPLRTCIKAKSGARGLQDSQIVKELLWLALAAVDEADPT